MKKLNSQGSAFINIIATLGIILWLFAISLLWQQGHLPQPSDYRVVHATIKGVECWGVQICHPLLFFKMWYGPYSTCKTEKEAVADKEFQSKKDQQDYILKHDTQWTEK